MKCAQAICLLFILVNLLLNPKNSFSQATAKFEVEALAPMGDWQDQYFAGAGVDFSLNYFLTNKFSLGVNSGFNYLFVQKTTQHSLLVTEAIFHLTLLLSSSDETKVIIQNQYNICVIESSIFFPDQIVHTGCEKIPDKRNF